MGLYGRITIHGYEEDDEMTTAKVFVDGSGYVRGLASVIYRGVGLALLRRIKMSVRKGVILAIAL